MSAQPSSGHAGSAGEEESTDDRVPGDGIYCLHEARLSSQPQTHTADPRPLLASGVEGKEGHKGNPKSMREILIVGQVL